MYTHVELKPKLPTHQKLESHQMMLIQLVQNHGNHSAMMMQLSRQHVEITCLLCTYYDQRNPHLRVHKPFHFYLSIARTRSTRVIKFIKRHVYKLCAHNRMPLTYVCVGISTTCLQCTCCTCVLITDTLVAHTIEITVVKEVGANLPKPVICLY